MRKPDDSGAAAFSVFNAAYGLGCVAVLIVVPVPHWGSGWLLAVAWPLVILFLIINVAGAFWSW